LTGRGVFVTLPNTLFANAAVPGLTSGQVGTHQVPLAETVQPDVITLTVGGNDLLAILDAPDQAPAVTGPFAVNLGNVRAVFFIGVQYLNNDSFHSSGVFNFDFNQISDT